MNKKVIFLAVGCIFVGIVFIFLVFSGTKKTSVSVPNKQSEQNNNVSIAPRTITTTQQELSSYSSTYFSFSYPSSLNIEEGIADTEGYTVIIKSQENFSPAFQIVIQANPTDKTTLDQVKAALAAFLLKPSPVSVGGTIPAVVYKDVSGKGQQEVTVFEQAGYVYRIDLSYASEQPNPQVEAYYREIVSSFNPR